MSDRIDVRKTYKLAIGGKFPRSESGRTYVVSGSDGSFVANASMASRKDARDAVVASRAAFAGWSSATAYNRGQVLYRVAEIMEGRRAQFVDELTSILGMDPQAADAQVNAAIDRWVWHAGWSDKFQQVHGTSNPVAGSYFNFSLPEPTGVVAVIAPARPALLALVSLVAPAIVSGNTCVVVAPDDAGPTAITLAEVLATSDVPGGVVNVLTGDASEIAPSLASHMDVNAIDLTGVDVAAWPALEAAAADNLKRVVRPPTGKVDWTNHQDPHQILQFTETKTVWHPIGA